MVHGWERLKLTHEHHWVDDGDGTVVAHDHVTFQSQLGVGAGVGPAVPQDEFDEPEPGVGEGVEPCQLVQLDEAELDVVRGVGQFDEGELLDVEPCQLVQLDEAELDVVRGVGQFDEGELLDVAAELDVGLGVGQTVEF